MTHDEKVAVLREYCFIVGTRDPRLNTDFDGRFMVAEPYGEDELPTRDGANGPWCVVGDDLESLVNMGYDFLSGMYFA